MSKGDINTFLKNLFQSEGGTNPRIVNQYGYIGKYQFGEDALADLGYYKSDGTRNRTLTGKFKYDWVGEWTGKNGVTCRDDFLGNESVQDKAAREWVKLLCTRAKKFKLQKYIGQTINNIQITESGIIAAAHLRGFGSTRSPGVRQFLTTNGSVDPKDANGTPVSKYMSIFANYDLGCCGSVTAVLIDKEKKPISGLGYHIKVGNKVVVKGKTDADGATKKVEGLDAGATITILVQRLEGGYKEVKSFIAHEQAAFVATLRSATRMVTTHLERHFGEAGDYKRQSELAKKKPLTSSQPLTKEKPEKNEAAPTNHAHSRKTSRQLTSANAKKFSESKVPQASSTPSTQGTNAEETTAMSTNDDNQPVMERDVSSSTQNRHEAMSKDTEPNDSSLQNSDKDVSAPVSTEQPITTKTVRNEDGHPVAVVKPDTSPSHQISPSAQKLEEILMWNVNFGKKKQTLSGPVAAERSRRGESISTYKKSREESLGQCYKYVKIALLASDMTKHYLAKEAAKDAGGELKKEGYRNLLDKPNHGLQSPFDAPVGAVIVYDVTDGTRWGHIEIRVTLGFASDYFSERPRTCSRNEKRINATMSGRSRKVSGIWIKE